MPIELIQEGVLIPCAKCGHPTSNIYSMEYQGKTITVCVCPECGESTANMPNKDNTPKQHTATCPFCQSTDCKKISGVSKIGKVALFGLLAAGSVSKTWHCNNCGSNFG